MSALISGVDSCDTVWFDGKTSRRHVARLIVAGDEVSVVTGCPLPPPCNELGATSGDAGAMPHDIRDVTIGSAARSALRVSARIGNTPYRLEFPDGGLAICSDTPFVERMFHVDTRGHWVPRMERASAVVAVALFGLVAAVYVAYQRVIPSAAAYVAQRIPHESEVALGDIAINSLERFGFSSTFVSSEEQTSIKADFEALAKAAKLSEVASLQFRRAPPNAFALPGGTIIVTDALVSLFRHDRRMLRAVLAHEIGHQQHRDSLRHILAASFSAVVMGAVTGDVSGVAALTFTVPALSTTLHFTRSMEEEADAYAFDLLKKTGGSPQDFADAIRRLRAMSQCVYLRMADRRAANRSPGPMHEPYQDDWNELSASSSTPARPPAPCFSDPDAYLKGREADIEAIDLSSGPLLYLRTHPIDGDRIHAAEAATTK